MCGRFAFYSPSEATAALFGVTGAPPVEARYNIAPTQYVASIRDGENGDRELAMLRWGLIPFWAKDPSIGNRMINARAETVSEKPAYRAAYKYRRCIVLADGFYEWQRDGSVKTPWYISQKCAAPMAIGALWENWHDKTSDDHIQSTTLITTAANDFMSSLHHRMPMVLDPGAVDDWLAGDNEMIEHATNLSPPLRAWPVDRRVNNARNQGDDLVEPAGETREM